MKSRSLCFLVINFMQSDCGMVPSWIYALLILSSTILTINCFELVVLHTNDVHAHYVQFNEFGGRCPPNLAKEGKCFGGFARQITKVKEIRANNPNVIFLNGGDFFQGTVWYTLYKYKAVAEFVNKLSIDAMSLGNHEFDDGLKDLIPYLETVEPTVVVCNINASQEPDIERLIKPSTILEVGGEKVGVIGYLTPETKYLSSTGKLEFTDEVECISREAKRLTAEGINKIIAVGHSGLVVDKHIAEIPEVDLVVGGHTNSFLYTGQPPSVEVPQGPYPLTVTRKDGPKGLVVQDFAFGKYMGYLKVAFDENGVVESYSGNPILLNSSVEEDPEVLELLEPYAKEVVKRGRQEVGRTNVLLRGDRTVCRMKECNLGNFLADAALDFFISSPTDKGWTNVAIAVWNSGGIRGSVDERLNNGSVILEDILTIAPFGNTMDIVGLKGKHLREVLETSVNEYDFEALDPPGAFLQVSGLQVTYNVSSPPGYRVLDVKVRCAECRIPKFLPLDDEHVYEVVMATYLTKGGDAFSIIPKYALSNRNTDELDIDIITAYMNKQKPIIHGLEKRVIVLSSKDHHDDDHHEEKHDDDHPEEKHDDEHPEEKHDDEHPEEKHDDEHPEEKHDDEHPEEKHDDEHHEEKHDDDHDVPHPKTDETFHGTREKEYTEPPHDDHHEETTPHSINDKLDATTRGSIFPGFSGARDRLEKARDKFGEGMKTFGEGSKKVLDDMTKSFPSIPGLGKPGDYKGQFEKARDKLGEGLKTFGEGSKKVLDDMTKVLPGFPGLR